MGFYGEVICYTTTQCAEPIRLVERIVEVLRLEDIRLWQGKEHPPGTVIQHVTRWQGSDDSWNRWQLRLAGVEPPPEEPDGEFQNEPLNCRDLQLLYVHGGRLIAQCSKSALAMTVSVAVDEIPEEIRDYFCPSAFPIISVGWHDIIDGNYGEPFLVDRAFLSVTLSNPGAPNNWNETRERILALPELHTFRAALEEIVGPMKSWVLWT